MAESFTGKGDVKIDRRAISALLGSPEVQADLRRRAERVRSLAAASAPHDSGDLSRSHTVESEVVKGRARSRVIAATPYAAIVGARTGYLGRALAEGGRS